jgi:serine/threonine-protein kinase RsbW
MSMDTISQHYEDLDCAIDDIRGLLNEWLAELDRATPDASPSTIRESSSSVSPPSSSRRPHAFGINGHSSASNRDASEENASEESTAEEDPSSSPNVSSHPQPPVSTNNRPPHAAENTAAGDEDADASAQGPVSRQTQNEPSGIETEQHPSESDNNASVVRYAQVVLHEWLANLVQHADFEERSPEIRVQIRAEKRTITCTVTDNSRGFDLQSKLAEQRNSAQALPERGMGLRIINACTQSCTYRPMDNGWHRFKFSIPADHEPWLTMLF